MTKSLRRALRACGAALAALLLVTCTDNPIGPARPGLARLRVAPQFDAFARVAPLAMDRFTITVVRPPADTLARVTKTFSPDSSAVSVPIDIFLQSTSETVDVTIELYAGSILLFRGTQSLTVTQGGSTPPSSIPVAYQGPGSQLASLVIGPRDTTVPFGATFAFGATAQDSQAAPVAQFYVAWSASGGTINGAGEFTAPAARDTVTVRAVTPTGVTDSTTVIIAAAPATLVKVSGDAQSGIIGSRLALPLGVRVDGNDGLPVGGVPVTFAVATGGGSVDSAVVVTDGAGLASMGATLGTTVGAQSFTASAPGLTAVTFAATGTGGGLKTWTGAVSTAWTTAGNWSPAAVPGTGDSVLVPAGTPNAPTASGGIAIGALELSGNAATLTIAGAFTVAQGVVLPDTSQFIQLTSGSLVAGSLTLDGFQAFVDASAGGLIVSGLTTLAGNSAFVDATGPGSNSLGGVILSGTSAFLQQNGGSSGPLLLNGSSAFWNPSGAVTVNGNPAAQVTGTSFLSGGTSGAKVTLNGDVIIGGTAAFFSPNTGDKWTINGDLSTTGGGTLVMNNVADTIEVNGNVSFGGGDESASLVAGILNVSGNFSQTGAGTTFIGSGTHTVFLDGAGAQTLDFAAPGFGAGRFQNVIIANSAGGVTATSDLYATGTAGVTPTAVRTLSGNGSTLFTTILNVSNFTFNNLLLDFNGSTVVTFDTVSFTGYAPTATPLTITHPGAASALAFQDVSFSVVPTSGFYLDATDSNPSDGVPLAIDMLSPSPLSDGGRVATSNATVTWPAGAAPGTWTGAVSTAWTTAGNWSDGQVPTAATDVTIPAGPSNMPVLGTTTGIQSLTVQASAALTLSGTMTLTLTGDLDDAGNLTSGGGGTQTIALAGAGRTVRTTNIPNPITVNVSGTYALAGRTVVTDLLIGTGGDLAVNGQTLVVGNLFNTTGSGTLTMTNPLDSVLVTGTANFGGGATTGRLTAGVLRVGGSLTQPSGSSAAFDASGTHHTLLTGAAPTVFIQNSGNTPGTSHFQELTWAGGGTLTLSTGPYVLGQLTVSSAGTIAGQSFVQSLHVGQLANAAALTLFNTQLWIETTLAVPVALSNLTITVGSGVSALYIRHPGLPAGGKLTLDQITFTSVPSNPPFTYLDVDDTAPADGNTLVIDVTNSAPAAPPANLILAANGAIVNWPPAGPVFTWTGATSTSWDVGSNWSTGVVPTNADDVVIPGGTPNNPTVVSSCSARSILVQSGAVLNLGAVNCQVQGSVRVDGTTAGTGAFQIQAAGQVQGNLRGLIISAPVSLSDIASIVGNLVITGAGASFDLNGFNTVVSGSLSVQSSGLLIMTHPADILTVAGDAVFAGGNELGQLSAGTLGIGGNFTQTNASGSGDSFHPSGTHNTILQPLGPVAVSFQTPGDVPGTSHFQNLQFAGFTPVTLTLASDVYAHGSFVLTNSGTTTFTSTNWAITVGDVVIGTPTVFDNTRLVVTDPLGVPSFLGAVTFQNMNPTVTQLSLTNNGSGSPLTLTDATFATTPTGGGLYLSATDADGPAVPFVVDLVNPTPGTAGGFIQAVNGAVVNWPAAAGVFTWTGAVDSDWNTAGNWSTGSVPTATDDVLLPAGPANQPQLSGSVTVNGFTMLGGATLSLGDVSLAVDGPAAIAGSLLGCCGDFVDLRGGGTLEGVHDNVTLSIAAGSVVTLSGDATLTASTVAVQGELVLAGHRLDLGLGSVNTTAGTGLLTMTNPADQVIAGFTDFSGGDETGRLTAGVIQVQGLSQGSGGAQHPASFFAGGNHRVVLGGPSSSSVTFADPGTSRFQELDVSGVSATLTLGSNVTVAGQLVSLPSGTPPVINGTAVTLTAGGADVDGLGFSGVPLVLSGGTIGAFSNVAFDNQSPVGTALTVNNVGQGTPFTFGNLAFSTSLTAGGFHLVANDLDGATPSPLVIDMIGASPPSGAGVSQATNGAVINWPPSGGTITWTGTVSTDWSTGGNWSGGVVPGLTENVVVPSGTPFQPVLTVNSQTGNLTVTPGASIDLGNLALGVSGSLDNGGSIGTTGTGILVLSGTGGQLLRGAVNADVTLPGSYLLNGRLTIAAPHLLAVSGTLELGGHTAEAGVLSVNGPSAVLRMLSAADSMIVGDIATFSGASTAGLLTAGVLTVGGDLIQVNTVSNESFQASGSHKTLFNGPVNPHAFTFFSPGPGANSRFQDVEMAVAGAGYAFLGSNATAAGNVTVTGAGGLDIGGATFTVGGSFTTSGAGTLTMNSGTDSLLVAGDASFNGGDISGLITGGVIVVGGDFTQGGTAAAPAFTAGGSNVVRLAGGATTVSSVGSNLTTVFSSLEIATTGPVTINGANTFNVDGTGTLQLLTPAAVTYNNGGRGALSFSGGTFTSAGSSVTAPVVELFPGSSIQGGWTVDTTMWNQGAALSLQVPKTIPYNHLVLRNGNNFFFDSGTWSIPGDLITRLVNAGTTRLSDQSGIPTKLTVGGLTQIFGQFLVSSGKLTTGSLDVATLGGSNGRLVMASNADSVVVSGDASFNGASTSGLLTAGTLLVGGNFTQGNATSGLSFAASGSHVTKLGSGAARTVTFATPGTGAGGSHFNTLDVTPATGGLTFTTDAFVDSTLAASVGAGTPKLSANGQKLTARQWSVQAGTVDHLQMALVEGATGLTQTFNGVTFSGFPTTATAEVLLDVSAVGSAAANRPITFNNVTVQTSLGSGGLYARLVSSNGLGVTLTMNASNDPTGGPSRSNPPFGTTVAGARIVWQ